MTPAAAAVASSSASGTSARSCVPGDDALEQDGAAGAVELEHTHAAAPGEPLERVELRVVGCGELEDGRSAVGQPHGLDVAAGGREAVSVWGQAPAVAAFGGLRESANVNGGWVGRLKCRPPREEITHGGRASANYPE
jgi:hypothetical protein